MYGIRTILLLIVCTPFEYPAEWPVYSHSVFYRDRLNELGLPSQRCNRKHPKDTIWRSSFCLLAAFNSAFLFNNSFTQFNRLLLTTNNYL